MDFVLRSIITPVRNFVKGRFIDFEVFGKIYSVYVNRGLFILASLICGFFAVQYDVAPKIIEDISFSPLRVVAEPNPTSALDPNKFPVQNNPNFASTPTWGQDFSGHQSGVLDSKYWNVLVGPAQNSNKEQQYYTSDFNNLRVENGALRLLAKHEPQPNGYNYSSARVETQGKQTFLYGRIDIVAKLPKGVGTWPAVWMLPANNLYADKSPEGSPLRYKNGGEIDIIEAVGFYPNTNYGVAHTASDHFLRSDGTGSHGVANIPKNSTTYNKYTLLWTPTKLTFMLNDKSYYSYSRQEGADYTTWPFDQPFYLIANLALGGSWGGMDTANYPINGIDNSSLPTSLDISSIYYYPYNGS